MKTKEDILKEKLRERYFGTLSSAFKNERDAEMFLDDIYLFIAQTREETIRGEIAYWTDVFDNRPEDRDLESDNIAQNFARIEIERLEDKLKK